MGFLSALILAAAQTAAVADSVAIEPRTFSLEVDDTRALEVRVYDAEGRTVEDAPVRWLTTDPEVVRVDPDGIVTALRPGSARVLARTRGGVAFARVTVPQLPPASIALGLPVETVRARTGVSLDVTVRTRLGDALPGAELAFGSTDGTVAVVDETGRLYARKPGTATIHARAGRASASLSVTVAPNPARTYSLNAPTQPVRTGDVLRLRVRANTPDGRRVGGIRPLWTVGGEGAQIEAEGGEGVFVAEEPGTYPVTAAIGEDLVRTTVVRVAPRRAEGRLSVVGRGPITGHHSGDTWVFEGTDGRDYAYIGTFMYDWMKVWDVTDPARPVLTDSVRLNARRINDVKIHPNGRIAVVTREGASDRKNGMVLLDLADPAHPEILSNYTETVSGGVHNVWIRGEHDLVYACHNGTSEMHIIDISDPKNPREVGRWGLDKSNKTLHDVIVQDGYAYLSYWDDGAVTLDVGAGTHDGTPTEPAFVSRYSYPAGNTHVAWRHGRYLFVGDEIFPAEWDADRPIEARGYVHVLDMADIENPVEVAKYEVPEAGAHNIWVEDDRLYIGYYQGGLRVVDVSGELRGDLYEQGREMAVLRTTDDRTTVPNWPMTWGAQLFEGRIYSSDMNSGLWITRFETPADERRAQSDRGAADVGGGR